jgi:IS4 transposase
MAKPAKLKTKVVETAFERMGMKEKLEKLWDIIDEIELEEELKISREACKRGEHDDVFEAMEEIRKEINK